DERQRLDEIRSRREVLQKEIADAIASVDRAEKEYRKSRLELLAASRKGNEQVEKEAYEKAMGLMKVRGACEEREKFLSGQREELAREERRSEKMITRSEEMGSRFRIALNMLNSEFSENSGEALSPREEDIFAGLRLAERESISLARELHDGPIQTFSATGLMMDLASEYLMRSDFEKARQELARGRENLAGALSDFRSFLFQLNPSGLKDGLDVALSRLASQSGNVKGTEVRYAVEGRSDTLSLSLRTAVFKIIQQAVMNAVRSGHARKVRIAVSIGKDVLRAKVVDDGAGFDVEKERKEAPARGSWGLVNMEARAQMIRGELSIVSEPGRGTVVSLTAPLNGREK
ncbi:MAG: sensor histidine kinase, partial [Synergistaceae bacterium]|nr:sensor histidine kinase [Synergistaceae bacterium]